MFSFVIVNDETIMANDEMMKGNDAYDMISHDSTDKLQLQPIIHISQAGLDTIFDSDMDKTPKEQRALREKIVFLSFA